MAESFIESELQRMNLNFNRSSLQKLIIFDPRVVENAEKSLWRQIRKHGDGRFTVRSQCLKRRRACQKAHSLYRLTWNIVLETINFLLTGFYRVGPI